MMMCTKYCGALVLGLTITLIGHAAAKPQFGGLGGLMGGGGGGAGGGIGGMLSGVGKGVLGAASGPLMDVGCKQVEAALRAAGQTEKADQAAMGCQVAGEIVKAEAEKTIDNLGDCVGNPSPACAAKLQQDLKDKQDTVQTIQTVAGRRRK